MEAGKRLKDPSKENRQVYFPRSWLWMSSRAENDRIQYQVVICQELSKGSGLQLVLTITQFLPGGIPTSSE